MHIHLPGGASLMHMGDLDLTVQLTFPSTTILLSLLVSLVLLALIRAAVLYAPFRRNQQKKQLAQQHSSSSSKDSVATEGGQQQQQVERSWSWSWGLGIVKWESLPITLPVSLRLSNSEMLGTPVGNGMGVGFGAPKRRIEMSQINWQARKGGPAFESPGRFLAALWPYRLLIHILIFSSSRIPE